MKLLVTGTLDKDEELFLKLENMGHSITYVHDERDISDMDFSVFEGVICNSLFLYNPIEKFTSLRYIQLTSHGLDRVPLNYIKEHNIELHNAKGAYSIPIAEYVVCSLLNVYRDTYSFYENQKRHIWQKNRGILELNGKKACIVGCGSIGRECAKRLSAFNVEVTGIDNDTEKKEYFNAIYGPDKLNEVIKESDITVLCLPLSENTHHLFDLERLELTKKNSVLVNVSRGPIIDEQALTETANRFKAVILDVFEEEPLSKDSPLWDMNNIVITPHNSFVSENNSARMNDIILENIKTYE